MIAFDAPIWLFGILALLVAYVVRHRHQRRSNTTRQSVSAIRHPKYTLLNSIATKHAQRIIATPWPWLVCCSLLFVALSGPQWHNAGPGDQSNSRNIVLTLDVSGSMRAEDFVVNKQVVNRLSMLKHIVHQFIEKQTGDRFSLIIFGDDAFTLTPLTSDQHLLLKLLSELQPNIAGEKTALGDAIALSTSRLAAVDNQGLIILLTDGANTSGTLHPSQALKFAKQAQIPIYPIGIGSHRRVAFPKAELEKPELTQMPLDEALLQTIANETGGRYFQADTTELLTSITEEISTIEAVAEETAISSTDTAWYWLPTLLALMLLLWQHYRRYKDVLPE